jgi:hypothetical protein
MRASYGEKTGVFVLFIVTEEELSGLDELDMHTIYNKAR